MIAIGSLISFFIFDVYPPTAFRQSSYKLDDLTIFVISFIKFFIWLSAFVTVVTGVQHYKTYLKLKK